MFIRLKVVRKRILFFGSWHQVNWRTALLLPISITCLLLLSLARPHAGYQDIEVKSASIDFMVAFDISTSMLAQDIHPNRLGFARRKLYDLLEYIKTEIPNAKIGLILYAGTSQVFCPLTSDYSLIKVFIDALKPDLIGEEGSDINSALELTIQSISQARTFTPSSKDQKAYMFLISDGEDAALDASKFASMLKSRQISLLALGIGTTQGSPIPLPSGSFVRDLKGDIVISKLEEETLQKLSQESEGMYARGSLDDSDLKTLLSQVKLPVEHNSETEHVKVYKELGVFLLWGVLLILIIAYVSGKPLLVFPILLLALPLNLPLQAEEKALSLSAAFEAYQNKNYEEALKSFLFHKNSNPENIKVLQGIGSSYYKLKNYPEALKYFSDIITQAKTGRDKFKALYNRGNSHFMLQDYTSAISDYEAALEIKPGDEKTIYNLELARKLLKQQEEQKPTPTPETEHTEDQEQEKNEDQSLSNEQNHSSSQGSSHSQQQFSGQSSSSINEGQDESEPREDNTNQGSSSESNKSNLSTQNQESSLSQSQDQNSSGNSQSTSSNGNISNDNTENQEGESSFSSDASKGKEHLQASGIPTHSPEALKEQAARAWLESLPDFPVLVPKQNKKRNNTSRQTW